MSFRHQIAQLFVPLSERAAAFLAAQIFKSIKLVFVDEESSIWNLAAFHIF